MKTRRKRISGTRGKYFYSVKDLSKKQNLILAFYLYQISIETDDIQNEMTKMQDEIEYEVDSVALSVGDMALCLDYLGYQTDRSDGYFSQMLFDSLKQFQHDYGLEVTGKLDVHTYNRLYGQTRYHWQTTTDTDTQLAEAVKVLQGM